MSTTTQVEDGFVYHADPHRENGIYEIVKREEDNGCHVVICGDEGHYVALHYISDGDGFGRAVYICSRTYKTLKGARKKARYWLAG